MKVLSNDILRPSLLERHFKQQHPILVSMTTFFSSEAESLKRMRLDKSGSYYTASFEISFMIAKQKTPHTIGEELLKPRVLKATQIILGEDTEQQIKSVTLTNNLVKRIIDDIAADIKSQITKKV
nr:unnamed protein product [Callosobruchus analis]